MELIARMNIPAMTSEAVIKTIAHRCFLHHWVNERFLVGASGDACPGLADFGCGFLAAVAGRELLMYMGLVYHKRHVAVNGAVCWPVGVYGVALWYTHARRERVNSLLKPRQCALAADQCQCIVELRAEWRPGDGDADEAKENARLLASDF